jgi:hypothetical protein
VGPEHVYYIAIAIMAIAEGVLRARGGQAFGRMVWVLATVFAVSFSAYQFGLWLGLDMRGPEIKFMPSVQFGLHALGFMAGLAVSRHLPGHIAAAIFLPMASVDLIRIVGMISAATWWWAIYYLALAQFLALTMGADLHPLGRWIRARAARFVDRLEYRGPVVWSGQWT